MTPYLQNEGVTLYQADCLDVLPLLPENSVDALCCDPPSGTGFMGMEWDEFKQGRAERNGNGQSDRDAYRATDRRRPGYAFQGGAGLSPWRRQAFITFLTAVMRQCLRVLKPGAWALVWAIPRTSHWTATAIEDAGFEIRDIVHHLFGQGMPKSRNLDEDLQQEGEQETERGYGTSLKPACEHWILARKPLGERTVAANVRRWGTGALNIDATRIAYASAADLAATRQGVAAMAASPERSKVGANKHVGWVRPWMETKSTVNQKSVTDKGRFPPNVALTHHPECQLLGRQTVNGNGHFPARRGPGGIGSNGQQGQEGLVERSVHAETVDAYDCHPECPIGQLNDQAGPQTRGGTPPRHKSRKTKNCYGAFNGQENPQGIGRSSGQVSRFYYCSKAPKSDRGEGNTHPTVKSTKLMRWMLELIVPVGGKVLDCFAGSGSTAVACVQGGWPFIGIEREAEYCVIAARRIQDALKAGMELFGTDLAEPLPVAANPEPPPELDPMTTLFPDF